MTHFKKKTKTHKWQSVQWSPQWLKKKGEPCHCHFANVYLPKINAVATNNHELLTHDISALCSAWKILFIELVVVQQGRLQTPLKQLYKQKKESIIWFLCITMQE